MSTEAAHTLSAWDLLTLSWGLVYWTTLALALLSIPSVLLQRRGRPTASLAWLLVLLAYPPVGLLAWWGVGRYHMVRKRRRHRRARARIAGRLAELHRSLSEGGTRFRPEAGSGLVQARHLLLDQDSGVFPTRRGNRLQILWDADQFYPVLEAAIRAAKHHVHFQFYIWQADATGRRFRDLLAEKAREGVQVRALYDAIGGAPVGKRGFMNRLREAGGRAAAFLPLRVLTRRVTVNFRNHRKIVVVDGEVAFTGGLNIGDEYTRDWHDLALRLEGPVVDQLQEVFAEDWYFASGEDIADPAYFGRYRQRKPSRDDDRLHDAVCRVIASGPDMSTNSTHEAFFLSITTATERVYLSTPYLVPDQGILMALRGAAFRGVDVRVMLPSKNDVPLVQWAARSYYDLLLEAGVRLFEYEGAVLHAKLAIFDHDWIAVGSANLDIRSFRLNFEAGCYIYSDVANAALAADFERDLARCTEVTAAQRRKRSRATQVLEAAANLFSPML